MASCAYFSLVLVWINNFATLLCFGGRHDPFLFHSVSLFAFIELWARRKVPRWEALDICLPAKLWIKIWWKPRDKRPRQGQNLLLWLEREVGKGDLAWLCHFSLLPQGVEGLWTSLCALCLLHSVRQVPSSHCMQNWKVRTTSALWTLAPTSLPYRGQSCTGSQGRSAKFRDLTNWPSHILPHLRFCESLRQEPCRGKEVSILLSRTLSN